LRAYGNAIVPQVAAEFVGAYLEVESGDPSESEGENLMSVLRNLGAAVEDNEEARNGL
jgi:hypothetical protein